MRTREDIARRVRLALAGFIAPDDMPRLFDGVKEEGWFTVRKYDCAELARDARATPYEEPITSGCNLLLTSGANAYHQRLIAAAVNAFSSANTRLAVGDSTTAVSAGQTDLQASTNRTRKIVDATPGISGNQISFVATFLTGEGNHSWQEAGIVNSATFGTGDMLNRVVQNFGTKTAGLQWVLTGTIALS